MLVGVGAAVAQDTPVRDHDIVLDDYFTIGAIGQIAASPDGKYVAYTETRWEPPRDKRNTDLWVVETETQQVRRLTFDRSGDRSPVWSPDSQFIYFTSSRKRGDDKDPPFGGKRQVWRIAVDGGASTPTAVTRVKDGIGMYELSADGRTLYYTTEREATEDEWKDLRGEYKKLNYAHGVTNFSQIWKLDLASWRAEKIVDEDRVIGAMKVSADQRRIAMLTTPDEELIFNEGRSRVDVYDATTKKVTTVTADGWRDGHASPYGWIDGVAWSSDGGSLAFTLSFDGYPTQLFVAEWDSGAGATLRELGRPRGITIMGGTMKWQPGTRALAFIGEDHARARVYSLNNIQLGRQGVVRTLTTGDFVVGGFDFVRSSGALAMVMGTTQHPPDIFLAAGGSTPQRLTRINPQVDTWKLPKISIVRWKGAGGDDVDGILELPRDHTPGTPLPMIVEIHGGPTSASTYSFRFWIYGRALLASKGYALLSPNYRGSTGYGDKFMVDLVGRENDIEVEDILKGVDAMVAKGIADPERLGVMGWSNGGFLTNCLIAKTNRFRAASSGAGVLDQVIQWGVEDTPGHVINYMKGLPWDLPGAYRSGSPLFNLGKVSTPTLIHVGEGDARVPSAHAKTLYRALRHYLHVPVELIVYPGEGHGLTTYDHRKAKMAWDLAWFDRYLGSTASPEADESDPGSTR